MILVLVGGGANPLTVIAMSQLARRRDVTAVTLNQRVIRRRAHGGPLGNETVADGVHDGQHQRPTN